MLAGADPILNTLNTGNDLEMQKEAEVVLATVPTSYNGSGLGLGPGPNRCNGFYHTKTRTVAVGPLLALKPGISTAQLWLQLSI